MFFDKKPWAALSDLVLAPWRFSMESSCVTIWRKQAKSCKNSLCSNSQPAFWRTAGGSPGSFSRMFSAHFTTGNTFMKRD